ncbi:MAG: hypothetical protein HYY49_03655 [Ignavibacteriales bacterium]|nr:hypothetical protein [Ignavibacteriales bacterium]
MKRKNLKAYLSGGMEYAANEGADWRVDLEQWIRAELGHSVFNPNKESEEYLRINFPDGNIRALKFEDVSRFAEILGGVVDLDSREVAKDSDYVICYWDEGAHRGAGTKGEITLAKYFRKPVYLVTAWKLEEIPGWVLGCVSRFFKSFDELKEFLANEYATTKQKSRGER